MARVVKPISFEEDVYKLLQPFEKGRKVSEVVNKAVRAYLANYPETMDKEQIREIVREFLKDEGFVRSSEAIKWENQSKNIEVDDGDKTDRDIKEALTEFVVRGITKNNS